MFRSIRWLMVWLLFAAGMINYMDRAALSIAAPLIEKDLQLDPAEMGLVFSSFFFGYAVFNFVGGWASDRFGPRKVFAVSMGFWSLFCAATAATHNFFSMLVVRVLFGVGEGPFCATGNKLVNNWFPRKEAATAVGLFNAGTPLGGAIAGPVVGYLAIAVGWRLAFVVIGLFGFAWIALWLAMATDTPARHKWLSGTERRIIDDGQRADANAGAPPDAAATHGRPEFTRLRDYLRQPTVLATALAFFGYNYILFFFLSWFPSYLTQVHHLSIKSMSLATVIPWLLGFLGLAVGGFISDAIFRMTGRALFSRKVVLVSGLASAAVCVAVAGQVRSVEGAVAAMSVSIFTLYLTGAIYWAIIQDTVRGGHVGGVSGFVHFLANLAGIVGPAVTGFIVKSSGSFSSAFMLAGAIAIVGAAAVALFVRPLRGLAMATREQAA